MENTSKVLENCQTLDFSNQKLNSLEEKHELGAGHLLSEPVETMDVVVGSITRSCQTIGSSAVKQNTSNEKHALVSSDVLCKLNDNVIVEPFAEEKLHVSGNSNMKENIIRGKTELDSGRVVGESSASLSVSPNAQHCQMMGSKDNELTLEKVQCEPMETGVVQSDSVEAVGSDAKEKSNIIGSSNIEENEVGVIPEHSNKYVQSEQEDILAEESDAQNFQTMVSSHNKLCSEEVQGATRGKRILESDSVEAGVSGTKPGGSAAQGFPISGGSILEQNGLDATLGLGPGHVSVEPKNVSEVVASEPMETRTLGFDAHNFQRVEHFTEHVKGEATEMKIDPVDVGFLDTPPIRATENSNSTDYKESAASLKSKKRKSTTPITGVPRVLRPRVNGLCKNPETYGSSGNITGEPGGSSANVNGEGEKRKKKRKRTTQEVDDEFSKTRKRLRYFLTRIGYEHNFIEAYCGEGWKGQSAEKIKPEKELQHAASRILQCKRRIRELFQHLDSSFAEGRFQESLFDSEGEISSDDIFCSKCGSKDLSADNDIILCDGICDRGFHQMCLKPPLLKEEIPPGDEGWLCPGCDCKVDCIDLLNDSQGTDLSIEDAWEKVFPEAATTVGGAMNDDILGLPSDDSEDDEYNPETLEVQEGTQGESSSSEDSGDSDFTSDSDDIGVHPMDDPYMGLPSEDSEDDDFDPDAPDPEKINEESSCSDFTSASEYFSASSDDNGSSGAEDDPMLSSVDGSKLPGTNSKGKKSGNKKKMNSELLSLLEPGSQSDPLLLSGKRQREQLDYKKLHDEAYGNDSSDSSDDEDWAEGAPSPRMKDDGAGEKSSLPRNTDSKTTTGRRNTKGLQRKDYEENGITSTRKTRQKKDVEGESNTTAEMQIDSPEPDLDDKRSRSSLSKGKALGEAVTERLYESFRENEYPTRDTKENLAKELGITIQQVTKWFGNARWSLRHQSSSESKKTNNFSETKDKTPSNLAEPEKEILPNGVDNNKIQEPSEAGNSKDVRSGRDDSAELDHQTLKDDSTNDKTLPASQIQDINKLVEPEAKILPGDRELIEAGTPKSVRTENEVCATPDHQTPNSTSDRELVIAIKANMPSAEEVKKKGQTNSASTEEVKRKGRKVNKVVPTRSQIQTRSRKSVTPQNK